MSVNGLIEYVFIHKNEKAKLNGRKKLRIEEMGVFTSYTTIVIAKGAEKSSELYQSWNSKKDYVRVELY